MSKKKEMLYKLPKLTITEPEAAVRPLPSVADCGLHVWRENDGTVAAYGYTMGGLHWMYLPGLASFCFTLSLLFMVLHLYFKASDTPPPKPGRRLVPVRLRS